MRCERLAVAAGNWDGAQKGRGRLAIGIVAGAVRGISKTGALSDVIGFDSSAKERPMLAACDSSDYVCTGE